MRIIAGKYKGLKIIAPTDLPVRPTTDQAKESLFNILDNQFYFPDLKVLDLFCGTGNISFEFCSRACLEVTAVDNHKNCIQFIKSFIKKNDMNGIQCLQDNVFKFLENPYSQFDIIFADPPYNISNFEILPDLIFNNNWLKEEGIFILEHSSLKKFDNNPYFYSIREYGQSAFSFFKKS